MAERRSGKAVLIGILGFVAYLISADASAATLVVDSLADGPLASIDGDKSCQLREAVRNVNAGGQVHADCAAADGMDDEIHFSVSGTIVLVGAADEDQAASGDLDLRRDVVIRNLSGAPVTLDGNGNDRVFDAVNGFVIDWAIFGSDQGIVIQNGLGGFSGGCILSGRDSTLTLDRVTVTGCEVGFNGAGLSTGGDTLVTNSTFSNNLQTADANGGGGIYSFLGTLEISNSVIAGNEAFRGGGVKVIQEANLIMEASTVTENHAREIGGGVDVFISQNDSVIRDGTVIEGNSAALGGGGISLTSTAQKVTRLDIEGSTIGSLEAPNHSDTDGGGIFVDRGDLRLIAGTRVVGNTATGSGGGIFIGFQGAMTLSGVVVSNNSATTGGGIDIFQSDGLIEDSLIAGNQASQSGGGLRFLAGAGEQLTIQRAIWRDNQAALDPAFNSGGGGAIVQEGFTAGQMTIDSSEFSGNQVLGSSLNAYGGAINLRLSSTIVNSTFSGNTAPNGGALGWSNGSVDSVINNATFYDNVSINDRGDHLGSILSAGSVQVTNSILALGSPGQHCFPASHTGIVVDGTNLSWQGGACDQAVEGDPRLGPLADNGGSGAGVPVAGFPRTHALIGEESAALDSALTLDCELDDQRGVLRNQRCDHGSYEATELFRDTIFQDRFADPSS